MTEIDTHLIDQFTGKRFLFVLGQYGKLGGAERQSLILAERLKKVVGAHVEFLAWDGNGVVDSQLAEMDIPTHRFPLDWHQGRLHQVFTLRRLGRFIQHQIRPDYLLPYIGFNCKIIGLIWKQCGAKFTWWNQRDEGREIYGSRLERRILASVPGIVSNSFEGRDFLVRKFGLSENEIRVINNGIVLPKPSCGDIWRRRLGLTSNDLLITMVANLSRFKDHSTLIRAFEELRKTEIGKRCHLCLAGSHGDVTQELKALGFELRMCDCLHLPGAVDDVAALWSATDLAVHSSNTEGCPNAVLEAMSHGLAVCGTDISGMRQALGESGSEFLVPPGNPRMLAGVIEKLLSDLNRKAECGTLNRSRVIESFSPVGLTRNVLNFIAERTVD